MLHYLQYLRHRLTPVPDLLPACGVSHAGRTGGGVGPLKSAGQVVMCGPLKSAGQVVVWASEVCWTGGGVGL